MLFKTNYSNLNKNNGKNFEPLPTGNYEMIIKKAGENATPKGSETFQVELVVRNDIKENGSYQNRHVFQDNWKRRNGPDAGQYPLQDMQHILLAAKVPEGAEIRSMEEFAKVITGKPVRVYVKKEYSEYRGKEVNQVAPWNYDETQYPTVNHQWSKGKPSSDDQDDEIHIDPNQFPF